MEGDLIVLRCDLTDNVNFNPLPPHGGRRACSIPDCRTAYISIHSLRMEGDRRFYTLSRPEFYFNPLPPHGGRLDIETYSSVDITFQSTPSAWRETDLDVPVPRAYGISIHSLRMEGDGTFCGG